MSRLNESNSWNRMKEKIILNKETKVLEFTSRISLRLLLASEKPSVEYSFMCAVL